MGENKSKKFVIIGLSVIAVALLGAGGVWGYFQYYAQSPEVQILESFAQLGDLKSVSYDANIMVSGESNPEKLLSDVFAGEGNSTSKPKMYSINLGLSGETDLNNEKSPASSLNLSLSLKKDEEVKPELKFQFINKDKIYYVRLPQLPDVEQTKEYSEFANKWIEFDYSKIAEQFAQIDEEIQKKLASSTPSEKDSVKIVDSVKRLAATHPPITVTKTFPDEQANGVTLRHFAYVPNKENIDLLLQELIKNEKITGIHQKDADDLHALFEKLSTVTGEIWFGKEDLHPYKIFFSVDIKDQEELQKGKVAMTLNLKNFNSPITIQKPTDTISFEEIVSKFFEIQMTKQMEKMNVQNNTLMFDSSSTSFGIQPLEKTTSSINSVPVSSFGIQPIDTNPLREKAVDTDGDGLADTEEIMIWKTDPKAKDTDGDGYDDNTEIKGGYDPTRPLKKLLDP